MIRKSIFAIVLIVVLTLSVMSVGAQAESTQAESNEQQPSLDYTKVIDKNDQLSDADEERVNEALAKASEKAGVPVCAYVFVPGIHSYGYEKYVGDDFLAEFGQSRNQPLILLVVTMGGYENYYNIYTYGDAYTRINEKEIDYILDDGDVYYNIKDARDGDLAAGLCAYAELSAQAYAGRLGVSWKLILIGALIIGAIAGAITVGSISAGYKKKNPSQSYPLDRFAKLELTHERDREVGKFVTTTIISTGGSGRGGGGGRTGGGGGHRGGR